MCLCDVALNIIAGCHLSHISRSQVNVKSHLMSLLSGALQVSRM